MRGIRITLRISFPFLLTLVTTLSFSQIPAPPTAGGDSFPQWLDFGEEQAHWIANYIRYANLQEKDHRPFKPLFERATQWEATHPDPALKNTLRLAETNMLLAEGRAEDAVRRLQEILRSGQALAQNDSISTYTFLADIFSGVEAYPEAWEMLRIRDRVLANAKEDSPFIQEFKKLRLAGLGFMYLSTNQDEKAIAQYRALIQLARQEKDLHFMASAHNNLGFTFLEIGLPDSALPQFHSSLTCWKLKLEALDQPSEDDLLFVDLVEGNIGQAYNGLGRYREALPLLRKDLRACRSAAYHSGMVSSLHRLGETYLGLHQADRALQVLDSAAQLMQEHPPILKVPENLRLKTAAYEALGRTDMAYASHKKWVAFRDSAAAVTDQNRVRVMEVVYEVDEAHRTLARQKHQLAEAEAEAQIQEERQLALTVGALMMLVIAVLLVYLAAHRKRIAEDLAEKNREIEAQKQIIQRSLTEKETLLQEVYHRVKNNLQMISGILELQAIQIKDEQVKAMLEESQSRVRSIAMIHQQLYQSEDLGELDFKKYLSKLVSGIAILCKGPDTEITWEIDVQGHSFDLNVAVSLGLIVNELVTNSFKHGFTGRRQGHIFIGIHTIGTHRYELLVRDDGLGIPDDFDPASQPSLGIRLVKGMSRQLGGAYAFSNEEGAAFRLQFTIEHERESHSHIARRG